MNYAIDHCEPFDGKKENLWMKCEHLGRYMFASDYLSEHQVERVLDAACAEGYGCMLLEKAGMHVYGADISETYITKATKRSNATFYIIDFDNEELSEIIEGCDAVVSFETIEHLDDPQGFLLQVYSVLRPNGIFLLSFPNSSFEKVDENGVNYDLFHKHIFQKQQMKSMVEAAGFILMDEFGQAGCNMMCKAESEAIKGRRITEAEIGKLFKYDDDSIISMTKIIGIPNKSDVDNTYSYLWILRKRG